MRSANMSREFDLERFVAAQREAYECALSEIREGKKRGHWMWYIFPQMRGLGHSAMAQHYAISGLDEARAYLGHPVLGPRLFEVTRALQDLPRPDAAQIFGPVDALKLRSSLTLFARAGDPSGLFQQALGRWFDGEEDKATARSL